MALVVFLRGVNVGGHKTFRPSALAGDLTEFGVVNIGAAGTFVVRKAVSREKLLTQFRRRLPFETEVVICNGRDLLGLDSENPFAGAPSDSNIVRFVSVLAKPSRTLPPIPMHLPPEGEWFLKIIATRQRFLFGVYRRRMESIRYLGQIDKFFGVPVTTRNWNTVAAIIKILKQQVTRS
jgi:uncharacterized protein (DUF1697 family)